MKKIHHSLSLLITSLCIIFSPVMIFAASPVWTIINSASFNQNWDVVTDASGNVFVLSNETNSINGTTDAVITKYTSTGYMTGKVYFDYHTGLDWGKKLMVEGAGNIYLLCTSTYVSGDDDIVLVKYSNNLIKQWHRYYEPYSGKTDEAVAMANDGSGNVYVAGNAKKGINNYDACIAKYNSAGTKLVSYVYDNAASGKTEKTTNLKINLFGQLAWLIQQTNATHGTQIAVLSMNGSLVKNFAAIFDFAQTGYKYDMPNDVYYDDYGLIYVAATCEKTATTDYTPVIIKVDQTGTVVWTTEIPSSIGKGAEKIFNDNGNLIVFTGGMRIIKMTQTLGIITVNKSIGSSLTLMDAKKDALNNFYVASRLKTTIPGNGGTVNATVQRVYKLNNAGTTLWSSNKNPVFPSTIEAPNAIAITSASAIYTCGVKDVNGALWAFNTTNNLKPTAIANESETAVEENNEQMRLSGIPDGSLEMTVYPNPATDVVNLKLKASPAEPLTVNVTNLNGQVVQKLEMASEKMQIAVSHLPAGIYYITVSHMGESKTFKIIKNNFRGNID